MSEIGTDSLADQIAKQKQVLQDARIAIDSKSQREIGWWSTGNAMTMSASVLVFGLIVLLVMAYQIKKYNITATESKLFIIVLVIVSSMFLVVSGYSDSQIAPVMALLGTIVGYILRGTHEGSPGMLRGNQGSQGVQGPQP